MIRDLYSKISPVKTTYNAIKIIVENHLDTKDKITIKIYSSIKDNGVC